MKRFVLVLLLALYVAGVTELKQLIKLPVLMEHYKEHKKLNKEISFLDFLYMHYLGDDQNDADQERDSQLPFMSHNDMETIDVQTIPAENPTISFYLVNSVKENKITNKHSDFSSAYLTAIWQPPKHA